MKTKRIITLIIITLVIVICASCNPFLPVYEKTETEEDGICVVIDGVKYKKKPVIKWDVISGGRTIGYAGDQTFRVSEGLDDPDRNFVFLDSYIGDYPPRKLYRADKTFPEPSAEIVDKIIWFDYLDGDQSKEYLYTTEDKDTIEELFKVLDTEIITTEFNSIMEGKRAINIGIVCYSSKLPGANYSLYVGISNGKIICGNLYDNEYIELPLELMERIAGKQIDISGFTE